MRRALRTFHVVSYLQYPMAVAAVAHVLLAVAAPGDEKLPLVNVVLVFMGLSVSFATLQDTATTQNELSRRVWASPRGGRIFLGALSLATLTLIGLGLWGVLGASHPQLEEVSLGLLALGIGMVGMLKAAGEMFEHHRADRSH